MDVIRVCAENYRGVPQKHVVTAVQRVWGSPRLIVNDNKAENCKQNVCTMKYFNKFKTFCYVHFVSFSHQRKFVRFNLDLQERCCKTLLCIVFGSLLNVNHYFVRVTFVSTILKCTDVSTAVMDVISACAENSWGTHKRVVTAVQRVWGSPRLIFNGNKAENCKRNVCTTKYCNKFKIFCSSVYLQHERKGTTYVLVVCRTVETEPEKLGRRSLLKRCCKFQLAINYFHVPLHTNIYFLHSKHTLCWSRFPSPPSLQKQLEHRPVLAQW